MLKILRISNFALIENLEIEFSPGLNLLTGETGSGKSIILDALGLLLGERASMDFLRTGASRCQIEALFISEAFPEAFIKALSDCGIGSAADELIIRREVNVQGKSRIFINDSLSTLSTLKSLAYYLVDSYGQGEFQSLLRTDEQRSFLDNFAENGPILEEVSQLYKRLRELANKRKSLLENEQERLKRIDLLRFQIDEIDKIRPYEGEDLELEQSRNILVNTARLTELAQRAYGYLYEDDVNLLKLFKLTADCLCQLQNIDSRSKLCHEQISTLRYSVQEVSYFIRDYLQGLEFEPQRLEETEERLHALERIKRKYGRTIKEVLTYRQKIGEELESLCSFEDYEKSLRQDYFNLFDQYRVKATMLTESRVEASSRLETRIENQLSELAMEKVRFQVRLQTLIPDQENIELINVSSHGLDRVEFYVAVNTGEELKPLSKTASGGELSRIMLALKCLVSGDIHLPTLIFDEVDTGIGGYVAGLVGKKLKSVSLKNQVICVTHMPQIASFAHRHFHVYKEESAGRTYTKVEQLENHRRTEEIARMLSGNQFSSITLQHAEELMKTS